MQRQASGLAVKMLKPHTGVPGFNTQLQLLTLASSYSKPQEAQVSGSYHPCERSEVSVRSLSPAPATAGSRRGTRSHICSPLPLHLSTEYICQQIGAGISPSTHIPHPSTWIWSQTLRDRGDGSSDWVPATQTESSGHCAFGSEPEIGVFSSKQKNFFNFLANQFQHYIKQQNIPWLSGMYVKITKLTEHSNSNQCNDILICQNKGEKFYDPSQKMQKKQSEINRQTTNWEKIFTTQIPEKESVPK